MVLVWLDSIDIKPTNHLQKLYYICLQVHHLFSSLCPQIAFNTQLFSYIPVLGCNDCFFLLYLEKCSGPSRCSHNIVFIQTAGMPTQCVSCMATCSITSCSLPGIVPYFLKFVASGRGASIQSDMQFQKSRLFSPSFSRKIR